MIKVDEKEVMRRQFYIEGKSIRQIAREHRCSRDTVFVPIRRRMKDQRRKAAEGRIHGLSQGIAQGLAALARAEAVEFR